MRFSKISLIKYISVIYLFTNIIFGYNLAAQNNPPKISELGKYSGYSFPVYGKFILNSRYIEMPDGVNLAVNIYLPEKRGKNEKIPTVLYLTRYCRSLEPKSILKHIKHVTTTASLYEINLLVSHGYGVVIVDIRGTGASFGHRMSEFSYEEITDGKSIVDWIIKQEWSNGKVGVTGVSYLGTSALLLLANKHPAVKACVPRSAVFDLYDDVTHPGGVFQEGFVKLWSNTTSSMDENNFRIFGFKGRLLKGIEPVESDKKRYLLSYAIRSRNNFDLFDEVSKLENRFSISTRYGTCLNDYGVSRWQKEILDSNTPIYIIAGWYDGAMTSSAVKAYYTFKDQSKILMCPSSHGCNDYATPFATKRNHNIPRVVTEIELLRFMDRYLKNIPNGIDLEPKETYWNVGKDKTNSPWVTGNEVFSSNTKLTSTYDQNFEIISDSNYYSGNGSRWNSLMPNYRRGPTRYPNLKKTHKNAFSVDFNNFQSQTLAGCVELKIGSLTTPHKKIPINLFCYLEEVTAKGEVRYITEGLFNYNAHLQDPKTTNITADQHVANEYANITFQPIMYTMGDNSKLRLVIVTSDRGHFVNNTPHHLKLLFEKKDKNHTLEISVPVRS